MAGVTFITLQSGRTGEWAAGYMRPTAPGCFVPLVIGCPTEQAATGEAQRLAAEAEQRTLRDPGPPRVGHWYPDDE